MLWVKAGISRRMVFHEDRHQRDSTSSAQRCTPTSLPKYSACLASTERWFAVCYTTPPGFPRLAYSIPTSQPTPCLCLGVRWERELHHLLHHSRHPNHGFQQVNSETESFRGFYNFDADVNLEGSNPRHEDAVSCVHYVSCPDLGRLHCAGGSGSIFSLCRVQFIGFKWARICACWTVPILAGVQVSCSNLFTWMTAVIQIWGDRWVIIVAKLRYLDESTSDWSSLCVI